MIPDIFKNATVVIGVNVTGDPDTQWIATGFFVGTPIADQAGRYLTYLVTNRHVIEGIPENELFISMNPVDGSPAQQIRLLVNSPVSGQPYWEYHPNPEVDIAVSAIGLGQPQFNHLVRNFFELDHHAIRRSEFIPKGLGEGSRVSVLGFPMAIVGDTRRSVVVRSGELAQLDDFLAGRSSSYLIDCATYPGNSGGPVINLLENAALTGTPAMMTVNLIGITAKSLMYRDLAVSLQSGELRELAQYNAGLSLVYSVDDIMGTIENLVTRSPS